MALRPLVFGARFQDGVRSVRVHAREGDPRRYVVEVRRRGSGTRRREHASLAAALREFAAAWRGRLH